MDLWIAESGGTKTDWLGLDRTQAPIQFSSPGLNPNVIGWDMVHQHLAALRDQLPCSPTSQIFFYGAGLGNPEARAQMLAALTQHLTHQAKCHVASDLEAAALAGLGERPGVVGILGTGSVAIRFDGKQITQRRGGLGYLLGDDGGGSQLGQVFLRALLSGSLPADISQAHQDFFGEPLETWTQRVYATANPVPVFTEQIPFLSQLRKHPQIEALLKRQFECFFVNTLLPLVATSEDRVVLLGGIAGEFPDFILSCAAACQVRPVIVSQRPILPLARTLLANLEQGSRFNTANIFDGSSETCAHLG